MDVSRLLAAPLARPANTTYKNSARVTSAEGVDSPAAPHRAARGVERVVQGELLQRERTFYQSTRAYLNERDFENPLPSERQAGIGRQGRTAIVHYLNNTRPEAIAELTQGQTVNYFV